MILSNRLYNALKWVALIALPASATAYMGLSALWTLPNPTEVTGTVVVVEVLLGSLLGLSTAQYNRNENRYDGTLNIDETDVSKIHTLDISTPPDELSGQNEMRLKINKVPVAEGGSFPTNE